MQSWRAPRTLSPPWSTSLNLIASASITANGRISPPSLRNFSTALPAVAIADLGKYARPRREDAHSCSAPVSLVAASPPCIRSDVRGGSHQIANPSSAPGSSSSEYFAISPLTPRVRARQSHMAAALTSPRLRGEREVGAVPNAITQRTLGRVGRGHVVDGEEAFGHLNSKSRRLRLPRMGALSPLRVNEL